MYHAVVLILFFNEKQRLTYSSDSHKFVVRHIGTFVGEQVICPLKYNLSFDKFRRPVDCVIPIVAISEVQRLADSSSSVSKQMGLSQTLSHNYDGRFFRDEAHLIMTLKLMILCLQVTVVDFPLYERLEFLRTLNPDILEDFPRLKDFMSRIEALPAIKKYMESDNFITSPFCNKPYYY